jgi:diaminopimelate epimerase
MLIHFYKYQGTGNDFIMVDDRTNTFPSSIDFIARLCDRRFGIGGDGLILIRKAEGFDFRMVYFNADGQEGSMCGNGGRCAVRFASDLGICNEETSFIAVDGPHEAVVTPEVISLKMSDVDGIIRHEDHDFLNTGSPHYITYVEDVTKEPVFETGKSIRYGEIYGPKGGTNVNFVEVKSRNTIRIRTYERGVEDETYSCGTGATAAVLSHYARNGSDNSVDVQVEGGQLNVRFESTGEGAFSNIWLTGPAVRVYEGELSPE